MSLPLFVFLLASWFGATFQQTTDTTLMNQRSCLRALLSQSGSACPDCANTPACNLSTSATYEYTQSWGRVACKLDLVSDLAFNSLFSTSSWNVIRDSVECAGIRASLKSLSVLDAPLLVDMPGLSSLQSLTTLELRNWPNVNYFSWPPTLEVGNFSGFANSPDWVGFPNLHQLRSVSFSNSECKDLQFTDVPRLSSLVLEGLSQLQHLTMDGPAALQTFDIDRIGGLASNRSLYIDLSDIMAQGATFAINAVGRNLATNCLGVRLNETSASGAVIAVSLRGLRRPTGVSLEGLRALRTLKVADSDLAWFDVEHIAGSPSGFSIEIDKSAFINETIYLSNKASDSRYGVDNAVVANLRSLSVTASRFPKFEVIGMYGLTSLIVSGGQDTTHFYLEDLRLTTLDLVQLDGNVSGLRMELENVSIVPYDRTPPPPFILDGTLSAMSTSLTSLRFTGGNDTALSTILLETMSSLKFLEIGHIGSLTSLKVTDTALTDLPLIKFDAISSAGVSVEFANVARPSEISFDSFAPAQLNAEFLKSIRSLSLRDVLAGVVSLRFRSLPKLSALSLSGYPSLVSLEIFHCSALSSLSLSAMRNVSTIVLDGTTGQLSTVKIDGTSGIGTSLLSLTIKNDAGSITDTIELTNLVALQTLMLRSMTALRRLTMTNCSIVDFNFASILASTTDIVLDGVFNQTGQPLSLVWSPNTAPALLRSLHVLPISVPIQVLNLTNFPELDTVSLRNSAGAKQIGISDCALLTSLTLEGVEGTITSLNLRRTGLGSIDLTRLAPSTTVRLIDNGALTGVCRLPDGYTGNCTITGNAFYADVNCKNKCFNSPIVLPNSVPAGPQQCPLPPMVTNCPTSNSISYQVVEGGATVCIAFDFDPSLMTTNQSCTAKVSGFSGSFDSLQFLNCYVAVEQAAVVEMSFIGANLSVVLSAGMSKHRFCGLGERVMTGGAAGTVSRVLATRATVCGATCPTPPPTTTIRPTTTTIATARTMTTTTTSPNSLSTTTMAMSTSITRTTTGVSPMGSPMSIDMTSLTTLANETMAITPTSLSATMPIDVVGDADPMLGVIIGAVVGGLALIALVVTAIVCAAKKRKSSQSAGDDSAMKTMQQTPTTSTTRAQNKSEYGAFPSSAAQPPDYDDVDDVRPQKNEYERVSVGVTEALYDKPALANEYEPANSTLN